MKVVRKETKVNIRQKLIQNTELKCVAPDLPGRLCNTSLLSACGVVRETAEMAGKGGGKARGAYFKVLTQKAVEAALAQGLETQEKLVVWLVLNFVLQP